MQMLMNYAKITTCCHITGGWSRRISCCSSYSRCCLCKVTVSLHQILRLSYQWTNSKIIGVSAQILPPYLLIITVFLLIALTEFLLLLTMIKYL